MKKIEILDSTLRDGAQGESVSFSVEDKLHIVRALDRLGIDYIEAGNPFSNPKDAEFFRRLGEVKLTCSKIVAFGSTRRRDTTVQEDRNCAALLEANTEYVSVFGKASAWQATEILGVSPEENLRMISDTVRYLCEQGRHVFFDAEHFFDGYRDNTEYSIQALEAAHHAGAERLILCDTSGGSFPDFIKRITARAVELFPNQIGIHCHDDAGCAVATSLLAVRAGAVQVQGTYTGIGERCGNTNLSTVIPNLQLKMGYRCIPEERMTDLTRTARLIAEISNVRLAHTMPYVGKSAFAHKGGMHADGVSKNPVSFEHINPEIVGNQRHILLSEVAGRAALVNRLAQVVPELAQDTEQSTRLVEKLKRLEYDGYQFEAAAASFELMVLKELGKFTSFFKVELFRIIGEQDCAERHMASAMVKLRVGDQIEMTADEGDGPVHALDRALRKALEGFYPALSGVRLTDYKVRVLDSHATAAMVRVLVESADGENVWTTVGVSTDIINASLHALIDSIEYKLYCDSMKRKKQSRKE